MSARWGEQCSLRKICAGADYRRSRAAFRQAASALGAELTEYRNEEASGPRGEALVTDVAVLGQAGAPKRLVIVSGTHGIEGIGGSAAQVALMASGLLEQRPPEVAVVLVHALNPFGFAHLRRVDERNVDVNRNFVDHERPLPHNAAYDDLHELLIPADWNGPAHARADARIGELVLERGRRTVQLAITGGQYHRAEGLFYGGTGPTWSNRTWRTILAHHVAGCEQGALVDLHTGLGPHGYGEPIYRGSVEPDPLARARRWYGDDLTLSQDGSSVSTEIAGNVAVAFGQALAGAQATAITLEFGTRSDLEVLTALRGDQWLANRGTAAAEVAAAIKRTIRDAFYPDEDAWRKPVVERAFEVTGRTLAGLTAERG